VTQWTETHPGAGDAESIRHAAMRYRAGADQLRHLVHALNRAPDQLASVWTGNDRAAWSSNCKADAGSIARSASSVDEVASVWLAYAEGVESIATRERRLRADPASAADENYTRLRLNELANERLSLDRLTTSRLSAAMRVVRTQPPFDVAGLPRSAWSMSGFAAYAAELSLKDAALLMAKLSALPPDRVAELWSRLSHTTRRQLTTSAPEIVGNLEGIPYADRDVANVSRLRALHAETLSAIDSSRLDPRLLGRADLLSALLERFAALTLLLDQFGDGKGLRADPPQFLINLDSNVQGPPLASISVGDLDTAANATWFVPGMNSSVLEARDYVRLAKNLNDRDDDKAVVLFLNYKSPGPVEVLNNTRAIAGADRLGAMLDGYNASRELAHASTRLNVVGHSYGTVVVAIALSAADRRVDSVSLVASAGIPSDINASSLHVDSTHVFATQAIADGIAPLGQFGSGRHDPTAPSWGARVFGSDGEVLPDGSELDAVDGHNAIGGTEQDDKYKYFGRDTESLVNIIHVIDGEYREVTR